MCATTPAWSDTADSEGLIGPVTGLPGLKTTWLDRTMRVHSVSGMTNTLGLVGEWYRKLHRAVVRLANESARPCREPNAGGVNPSPALRSGERFSHYSRSRIRIALR